MGGLGGASMLQGEMEPKFIRYGKKQGMNFQP